MNDDTRHDTIEALTFDVKQGLRKARPSFPARRGARDDDTSLGLIAETVVEHLELAGWRLTRLPPVPLHSTGTAKCEEERHETDAGDNAT